MKNKINKLIDKITLPSSDTEWGSAEHRAEHEASVQEEIRRRNEAYLQPDLSVEMEMIRSSYTDRMEKAMSHPLDEVEQVQRRTEAEIAGAFSDTSESAIGSLSEEHQVIFQHIAEAAQTGGLIEYTKEGEVQSFDKGDIRTESFGRAGNSQVDQMLAGVNDPEIRRTMSNALDEIRFQQARTALENGNGDGYLQLVAGIGNLQARSTVHMVLRSGQQLRDAQEGKYAPMYEAGEKDALSVADTLWAGIGNPKNRTVGKRMSLAIRKARRPQELANIDAKYAEVAKRDYASTQNEIVAMEESMTTETEQEVAKLHAIRDAYRAQATASRIIRERALQSFDTKSSTASSPEADESFDFFTKQPDTNKIDDDEIDSFPYFREKSD